MDVIIKQPLYKNLMSSLIDKIKTLNPNQKLPSERTFVSTLNVSRATVRKALRELEERGYVYRLHGKGTYVSSFFLDRPNLGDMYSFSNEMTIEGKRPRAKNISLKLVTPDKKILEQLNLLDDEKAYELTRVRFADDKPLLYSKSYLPEKIFPDLNIEELNNSTLYKLMKDKYNQLTVLAFEEVQAVNLNYDEAKKLQVESNSASLKINRKTINEKNIPIEFTQTLARGDTFIYRSKQYNKDNV